MFVRRYLSVSPFGIASSSIVGIVVQHRVFTQGEGGKIQ